MTRAEADHHRDEAKRVAHPLLERSRDLGEGHPGRNADEERADGKRNERRNPDPCDQDDDQGDAEKRDEEQRTGVDRWQGVQSLQ